MNKRILGVVLVAILAVALVLGGIVVSAADGVTTTEQISKITANGGTIKLGANFGIDGVGGNFKITVLKDKPVTLDLNGYTMTGVGIEVTDGASLTIIDSDAQNLGLFNAGTYATINVAATSDSKKQTTLVINGGMFEDNAAATGTGVITVGAGSKVVINNVKSFNSTKRAAIATSGNATIEVNGGKLVGAPTAIDAQANGTIKVTGGEVVGMQLNNKAVATVEGGKLSGNTHIAKADLNLYGGELVKGATVTVYDRGLVYVDGATVAGKISGGAGEYGDLDIHSGYFTADASIDIDQPDITGGEFEFDPQSVEKITGEKSNLLDTRRASCVKYVNWTLDKDGVASPKTTWLVGQKVINAKASTAESVTDKGKVLHCDSFVVELNAEDLNLTVTKSDIYMTYADKVTGVCVVNKYQLGTNLQQGGSVDANGTPAKGQPIHDWGTVVKATPYVCGQKVVIVDYTPDTLNAKEYIVADDKGEMTSVDGKYTAAFVGADGKTFTDAITKKLFGVVDQKGLPVINEAGHLANPVAFKVPTATEAGVYQHYVCEVCGKAFATFTWNQNGFGGTGLEVDPAQLVIPALGTGTTTTPTDPTPTDPGKKPDEGGSDITTDPGKTGDVDNFAWVVCLAVSAIGAVAVAGSMVASKKYDR